RYRQSRGYGYRHIRQDLQRRGIAQELIARYLSPDDERWEMILDELVMKRCLSVVKIAAGGDFHQRLVRFLQGRGFHDSEINRALAGLLMQA
ncbi:MAG: RecX family transcriptional regulator, partial [Pseudohongiellaceae bacterium]